MRSDVTPCNLNTLLSELVDVPELTKLERADTDGKIKNEFTLFIPLLFWFCRNPGLALPLIALQYHEVRLDIEFIEANKLGVYTYGFNSRNLTIKDASLLTDYVYLDSEERRRFAQVGHEYLIEQLFGEDGELTVTR